MHTTLPRHTTALDESDDAPMTGEIMRTSDSVRALGVYAALGTLFGIVITKSEVISWFRIQEMFRFQSAHMYGVMATAVATALIGQQLIRRLGIASISGEPIEVPDKVMGRGTRYWAGGTLFGLGWAMVGACPGPLFALVGSGVSVMLVAIVSALVGTWSYGALRDRLPH
jgi:uncharacterized protein